MKGLKVPTKLTNNYHKKLKGIEKMYEPIKYVIINVVWIKYGLMGIRKLY